MHLYYIFIIIITYYIRRVYYVHCYVMCVYYIISLKTFLVIPRNNFYINLISLHKHFSVSYD